MEAVAGTILVVTRWRFGRSERFDSFGSPPTLQQVSTPDLASKRCLVLQAVYGASSAARVRS